MPALAITHVQQFGQFTSGGATSTTGNVTVTANNSLVCGTAEIGNSGLTATATDTLGNTWVTSLGPFSGLLGGSLPVEIYVFSVAALNGSGTDAVTITWSSAPANNIRVHCHEVSGINPTIADKTNTASGSTASVSSGNVTTTSANEFLYGYAVDNNAALLLGSGWTQGITEASQFDEYQIVTSTGTFAATYTNGTSWLCVIATFKVNTGPAPGSKIGGLSKFGGKSKWD